MTMLQLLVPDEIDSDVPAEPVDLEAIETIPATGETEADASETEGSQAECPIEPCRDDRKERLEREISDLVIEDAELSERKKSIKKRISCLAEELSGLRAECHLKPQSRGEVTAQPVVALLQPAQGEEWRAAPIAELHLKQNVHDKLAEAGAVTIGRLEDLRAEIALGKEKWPKGIGAAKITEIEDAVVKWLTANRDRATFDAAKTSMETVAADCSVDDL